MNLYPVRVTGVQIDRQLCGGTDPKNCAGIFHRMTLNEYLAQHKRGAYEDVLSGVAPQGFRCDAALLRDLFERGKPTMGTTVLKPELVVFEFIFSLDDGQTEVFTVELDPPERIVFLPVPEWVVESIWQGEVQGSHHFESDARALVANLASELEPLHNAKWFEKQKAKRRE